MSAYMEWVTSSTPTRWWYDSASLADVQRARISGAVGVTTNPQICYKEASGNEAFWREKFAALPPCSGSDKAEAEIHEILKSLFEEMLPVYEATDGELGRVCFQVDPNNHGDYFKMREQAMRARSWAPNISIKLPATHSAMRLLEELIADGQHVTVTLGFCVPQLVEVARHHQIGIEMAKQRGVKPGGCNAVMMIGRADEYLSDVAKDSGLQIPAEALRWAGIAMVRRANQIFEERRYSTRILLAAFRGTHHFTELVGGSHVDFAASYGMVDKLDAMNAPHEIGINRPMPDGVLDTLMQIKDFRRFYDPAGVPADRFISEGVVQRTIGNFTDAGWKLLVNF